MKITTFDQSHQIRHVALLKKLQELKQTTSKNMTQSQTYINTVNATLTRDILQTRLFMTMRLTDKISTSNFSKLINDSQYVVDQLYGMVCTLFYLFFFNFFRK